MICGHNSEGKFEFRSQDYISGVEFEVWSCPQCKLAFTKTGSNIITDDSHYPTDYYGKNSRYNVALSKLLTIFIRQRARAFDGLPSSGAFLDIGCGQGWFVKEFNDRGWHSTGIEVSEEAAFHAKSALKQNILVGENSTQDLKSNQYDAICLWHVLEHLEQPDKMLHEISRLLKKDGQAIIGVPNFGSTEAKIGRAGWFHLDVPRHLFHFNKINLTDMVANAGLSVVKESYFVPEYDFYSFVQTMQNRIGIKTNLLYSVIRKGSLGRGKSRAKWYDWLALVITTPIFSVLSLIIVPILILFKNGSSLTLTVKNND